jgi:energy-coupling factor transporter ATP-binding protein EcfA2
MQATTQQHQPPAPPHGEAAPEAGIGAKDYFGLGSALVVGALLALLAVWLKRLFPDPLPPPPPTDKVGVLFLGEGGAGKSTLIRALNAEISPTTTKTLAYTESVATYHPAGAPRAIEIIFGDYSGQRFDTVVSEITGGKRRLSASTLSTLIFVLEIAPGDTPSASLDFDAPALATFRERMEYYSHPGFIQAHFNMVLGKGSLKQILILVNKIDAFRELNEASKQQLVARAKQFAGQLESAFNVPTEVLLTSGRTGAGMWNVWSRLLLGRLTAAG